MMFHNPLTSPHFSIKSKGTLISLQKPIVMGILNTSPDSFYDGGKYSTLETALFQIEKMLLEGASIIDIGGFSSRPGADEISEEEELSRVIPFIERAIHTFPKVVISIDTFRAKIAHESIQAGASIINDISAGDDDLAMIETVSKLKVPYIAMHKKGKSKTMQVNPNYKNVKTEILDYLIKKVGLLKQAGVIDIIIDPGFGFGKNLKHNYELLKNLPIFEMLDCPILVGMSRKRMVNEVLNISSKDALNGTTVVNTIALLNGAQILRVHDVKEAVEAIKIVDYLRETN
jgi:dihydropteroate synthase